MYNHGFVKVAAAVPSVKVADCSYNAGNIVKMIKEASEKGVSIIAFPELSISGYSCLDLFAQQILLDNAKTSLKQIADDTADVNIVSIVGLPLVAENKLINAAAILYKGEVLGIVPKSFLPNYKEFQEKRWFSSGFDLKNDSIELFGKSTPISNRLLFKSDEVCFGVEICEDLWVPIPPSSYTAMQGAEIIFNLSASNETIGKNRYLTSLIEQQSARCLAGYVYASAGFGESTTDLVFAGNGIIAENGVTLAKTERSAIESRMAISEIDVQTLRHDRLVNTSFEQGLADYGERECIAVEFDLPKSEESKLTRQVDPHPFIPTGMALNERCEEILNIQVSGLAKRLAHTHSKKAVIGISGGLDSTLALLVTVMTFDVLKLDRSGVIGVTMPGFGTTGRTYNNAVNLIRSLGVTLKEISIREACELHFKDIEHDPSVHDVTYENSQARERTQILMDLANKENGLVVGTGDLSELALGWATYNGDQMSMYGVNASVPKTLVKHLVEWVANNRMDAQSKETLIDIVDTPISPELIPADENGNIKQKTEDLVGPYELHDFFLYHFLRHGASPTKIYYLANIAFEGVYDKETIKKWLYTFFRRFFQQQFKRSCMPDGPKVGSITLSPRGDWRMPSDAMSTIWLSEIEKL